MTNELKNVPELRFSNFCDEWVNYKLGEIVDIRGRIGFRGYTKSDIINKEDGGVLTFSPTNIIYNKLKNTVHDTYITKEKYEESPEIMVKTGDILFVKTGSTLGKSTLVANLNEEATVNPQIAVMRVKVFFHQKFTSTYLTLNKILRQVAQTRIGGAIPTLTESEIKKFQVSFPVYEEQQKIGNFFSKLDRQIELEEEKLELLEQQKKGYMQKIFSQELRLKDENGNLSPEWTQTQLKNITNRITRKNKKLESTRPLTISGQLGLIDQVEYFNKSVSSKNLENYTLLQKNEFAYNKSYSNGYPLGAIKRLTRYDKGVLSSLYICFSISSDISVDFMQYYFESTKWFREVASIAVEGARNHGLLNISVNDFFDISIKLPSLENQKKISSFLIKIDNLIEKQSSKVELLKQRKQGLLQKMFI